MASEKRQAVSGPKSVNVRLDGGAHEMALVRAQVTARGAVSFVLIERGKGKDKTRERGATSQHSNLEEATTTVQAISKRMQASGWRVRPNRGFGQRRPDTFSARELPAPSKK
jgi:hypothetical protein